MGNKDLKILKEKDSLLCLLRHLSNAPVNITGWKQGARRTIIEWRTEIIFGRSLALRKGTETKSSERGEENRLVLDKINACIPSPARTEWTGWAHGLSEWTAWFILISRSFSRDQFFWSKELDSVSKEGKRGEREFFVQYSDFRVLLLAKKVNALRSTPGPQGLCVRCFSFPFSHARGVNAQKFIHYLAHYYSWSKAMFPFCSSIHKTSP